MTRPDIIMPQDTPQYRLAYAIAHQVKNQGGVAYLVGGCVRDAMLGIIPKDLDLEVFGIAEDKMDSLLFQCGSLKRAGRSFPVWKVWRDDDQGNAIDVSLPRAEVKTGDHHTDFSVTLDPGMSFVDAASSRDYSINAMGYNPLNGTLLDPFNGEGDLKARLLRHVSGHFVEDPLRVLRGMQFTARFDLIACFETIDLCKTLSPVHLSAERIWEEWCKLILKGVKPSCGLTFLRQTGWIKHFPELAALIDVPQDPEWHPEGPVHLHLDHCMDAFAKTRIGDDREDLIVGLAVLCHDLAKATTTKLIDGRWTAHGHEEAGEEPTRTFLGRLTNDADLINDVVALVRRHMVPTFLYKEATRGGEVKLMNRSLRRLAREVRLDRLARVVLADKSGRPPKPQVSPEADWLRQRAAELGVEKEKPKPILMGRHLIELGLTPGLAFKSILEAAMEKQLDGDISTLDEAIEYAKVQISSNQP